MPISTISRYQLPKPSDADAAASKAKKRLLSLDLLRGLDIFMLTALCDSGLVYALGERGHWPGWLMAQFAHPDWVGFSLHDLIMPLFIFMTGASIPLALPKRLEADGTAGWAYWRHVLSRVGLLWFLGMVSQGCLFAFDLAQVSFFNNTLQTIAVGYLIAAAVARIPSRGVRIAFPFALAAAYALLVHTLGDFSPNGNFAVVYETKFLQLVYPKALWNSWCVTQIAEWHYTWWTTVPMFGVMALAGCQATEVVLSKRSHRAKVGVLVGVGFALLALGGLLLTFDPCIKHIFTASFTALAMGCSFLFYALCYLFADVLEFAPGSSLFLLYGRHSLLAYLLGGALSCVTWGLVHLALMNGEWDNFKVGLIRFLPEDCRQIALSLVFALVLTGILYLRDRLSRKS